MKNILFLSNTLAAVLLSSTVMAANFHALTAVQSAPGPIQDKELSAIEGGAICHFQTIGSGLSICDVVTAWPISIITPDSVFAADNGLSFVEGQSLQFIK
jgi:hypothetical protein